jgi:hypothetical protein
MDPATHLPLWCLWFTSTSFDGREIDAIRATVELLRMSGILCDEKTMVTDMHPDRIQGLPKTVRTLITGDAPGIYERSTTPGRRESTETGRIWCAMATCYAFVPHFSGALCPNEVFQFVQADESSYVTWNEPLHPQRASRHQLFLKQSACEKIVRSHVLAITELLDLRTVIVTAPLCRAASLMEAWAAAHAMTLHEFVSNLMYGDPGHLELSVMDYVPVLDLMSRQDFRNF